MSGYERKNRNVLRRCLKTASDDAAVTWAGSSFHTTAPEAVNVRLLTVDRRMIGTGDTIHVSEMLRNKLYENGLLYYKNR